MQRVLGSIACFAFKIFDLTPGVYNVYNDQQLVTNTYGSVSAGREIWLFRVIFFQKVVPSCDQT